METGKYLIIYYRNGYLYSTSYGDDKTVERYLKQGFIVSIFDDRKHAVEALNDYQKYINEQTIKGGALNAPTATAVRGNI